MNLFLKLTNKIWAIYIRIILQNIRKKSIFPLNKKFKNMKQQDHFLKTKNFYNIKKIFKIVQIVL